LHFHLRTPARRLQKRAPYVRDLYLMVREFRAHGLTPNAVSLTTYGRELEVLMRTPLQELVGQTTTGTRHVQIA